MRRRTDEEAVECCLQIVSGSLSMEMGSTSNIPTGVLPPPPLPLQPVVGVVVVAWRDGAVDGGGRDDDADFEEGLEKGCLPFLSAEPLLLGDGRAVGDGLP